MIFWSTSDIKVQSIGYISTIKGINLLEDLIWFCGKSCGKINKKLKTF